MLKIQLNCISIMHQYIYTKLLGSKVHRGARANTLKFSVSSI